MKSCFDRVRPGDIITVHAGTEDEWLFRVEKLPAHARQCPCSSPRTTFLWGTHLPSRKSRKNQFTGWQGFNLENRNGKKIEKGPRQ